MSWKLDNIITFVSLSYNQYFGYNQSAKSVMNRGCFAMWSLLIYAGPVLEGKLVWLLFSIVLKNHMKKKPINYWVLMVNNLLTSQSNCNGNFNGIKPIKWVIDWNGLEP